MTPAEENYERARRNFDRAFKIWIVVFVFWGAATFALRVVVIYSEFEHRHDQKPPRHEKWAYDGGDQEDNR